MRTVLVADGAVRNVVIAGDGFKAPAGFTAVASETANIGDSYDGTAFASPADAPLTKDQLIALATGKQAAVSSIGALTVDVGGSQSVIASLSAHSVVDLLGAYSLAITNDGMRFDWADSSGAGVTLTAAQVKTVFAAVAAFRQASYTALRAVCAAIDTGAITSAGQIETPPSGVAPWPVAA